MFHAHRAQWIVPVLLMTGVVSPFSAAAQDVITFDNLPNEPNVTGFTTFVNANGGSRTFDAVTFAANIDIVGDQYHEGLHGGTDAFASPHSGHYAMFVFGGSTSLTTDKTLSGLYVGRNDYGDGSFGASSIAVRALSGSTVLGSVNANLTSTTLSFLDTSSFTSLSGITGYRLDVLTSSSMGMQYVADDLTFVIPSDVPGPGALPIFAGGLAAGVTFLRKRWVR